MPDTERGVQLTADRLGWNDHPFARTRQGRGGGMEYRYLILPVAAQIAYMQRHKLIGGDKPVAPTETQFSGEGLTARARTERDARLAILAAYDDFLKGLRAKGRAPATALHLFSIKYNNRSLQVADWLRETIPSISPRTIMRWRSTAKKNANKLAVDRSKGRKGSGALETANGGAVKAFILGLIAHQPHLSAKQVLTLCRSEFGDRLTVSTKAGETSLDMPPVRTFQHFLKGLKQDHQVELMKLTNPDRFRSTMLPSGTGTLKHITVPNALWQIDASPVDALCTDGRHSVYVCVDIATRRFMPYVLEDASRLCSRPADPQGYPRLGRSRYDQDRQRLGFHRA
jgi:putative transposase